MNDLYLIGNGFDLAHGLETSYQHFLLWYLKNSIQECNSSNEFSDKLISLKRDHYVWSGLKDCQSVKEILDDMSRMEFSIKFKYNFFEHLVCHCYQHKWVDIEHEYYTALVELSQKLRRNGVSRSNQVEKELGDLNKCFKVVKEKLIEYLCTIKITSELRNQEMQQILGINDKDILGRKLFVCFNYTHTVDKLYLKNTSFKDDVNYIHGELDDSSNPIIFGYSDNVDTEFGYMKELSNRDFLTNIKPLNFVTDNYRKVLDFIRSGNFVVKILGHSCGQSDRYILSKIFEHENCQGIEIYHYKNDFPEDDYREKKTEIFGHLKNKDINVLVSPFNRYNKMPQNPKKN